MNDPVDTTPKPSALYTNRRILFVLLVLVLLPVVVFAALNPTIFSPKASTGLPIASVKISPGEIITKPLGSEIHLSTLAYDTGGNPITSGVTYQWGMSSTNSIGTIVQEQGNGALGTFTPSANVGRGDLWVRAFAGESQGLGSIPVYVGTTPPTPTPTPAASFGNAGDFSEGAEVLVTRNDRIIAFSDEFTVEAWILTPVNPNRDYEILSSAYEGYGEGRPFRLFLHTEYGALRIRSTIRGTNGQLYNINGTAILNQNQWYHIAYSKEQSRARLFLNGRVEGSVNMSYPPTRITNFSIGALRQGVSVTNSFARQIDEVVVYTYPKYWNVNSFSPPIAPIDPAPYIQMLYHFDQDNGTSWFSDSSGNSYDGINLGVRFVPSTVGQTPPSPTPTSTPTPTPRPLPTPTLTPTPTPRPTPTPSPTPRPVPTATPTPTPKPRPSPTPTPTPAPNHTPTISTSSMPVLAKLGKQYTGTVVVTDVDQSDILSMNVTGLPKGIIQGPCYQTHISGTTELSCTITGSSKAMGVYPIQIRAQDNRGGVTNKSTALFVIPMP